jgi:Protein of unknown function (DUF2917)
MNNLDPILSDSGTFYFRFRDGKLATVHGPLEFKVVSGRAWVTVEGEPDDWFIRPGESFSVPAGRSTVIEADPDCVLSFEAATPAICNAFGQPGLLPRVKAWFHPSIAAGA